MYAVVSAGGKQYRLSPGQVLEVEKLPAAVGDQVVFDEVLLVGDGEQLQVGTPLVEGARVIGTVVDQGKGEKIIVFKFKRRKMYRRKRGHRQLLTTVQIDEIISPESGEGEIAESVAEASGELETPSASRKQARQTRRKPVAPADAPDDDSSAETSEKED